MSVSAKRLRWVDVSDSQGSDRDTVGNDFSLFFTSLFDVLGLIQVMQRKSFLHFHILDLKNCVKVSGRCEKNKMKCENQKIFDKFSKMFGTTYLPNTASPADQDELMQGDQPEY